MVLVISGGPTRSVSLSKQLAPLCCAVACCAVQADQEVDFDIMDDVLLMADDPSMPGGGADDDDEGIGNPAAGLSIDSFMGSGMLPGAGSSELGAAYLEDVLAPAGDEELEEELLD
jgi:hypothetical protein